MEKHKKRKKCTARGDTSSPPLRRRCAMEERLTPIRNCGGYGMGQQFYQSFSNFGAVPAESIARVVGHDQTILCGRPPEVAPHALAIQADFRASGDRSLAQINNKRGPISSGIERKEFEKQLLQCQEKGAEEDARTAELWKH